MHKFLKVPLLFFALCWVSELAHAQIIQRHILTKKYPIEAVKQALVPTAAFNPYPKTPEAWQAAVPPSLLTAIVKRADTLLTYDFEAISATTSLDFVRSGDRTRHATISFGKRIALMNLILAESIEGKNRFTEAILNGVWSICEESYWGVPAHIGTTGLPDVEHPRVDLFSAETAAVMGLADYFVGDKLDKINKLIRKRMYFETNKRLFEPILDNPDSYIWMSKTKPVNNWNPWIMSNWMTATLLLEKNETRRAEMLHASMKGLDSYLNGLGEDGGCDEGPSYWFAAGASVYDCLELLAHATNGKVYIYNETLIQKMASYIYKTHIDGEYFVNFADADPKLRPDGLLLYRFGKAIKDETMVNMGYWAHEKFTDMDFRGGFHRPRTIQNLLTFNQLEKNPPAYQPLKDAWIGDIQVLTARSKNGFFLATHGGHNNESHNHNDVGDFMLYADGEPIIIDAGRGNYTARTFSSKRYELWFTQSEHHNLPIVNGIGQSAGRSFEAKNIKHIINEKEASLEMDIAAAYAKEAGIQAWKRVVKLNRVKNQVEISDDFTLNKKPNALHQIFMTVCKTDVSKAGKIVFTTPKNAVYTLEYDPSVWAASTEFPSTEGMEYSSFKTKWSGHQVQRIILTHKKLADKGRVNFVILKN
jgi:hypothetical protein